MEAMILGVAGGTGSGKTTVAREILDAVGADRIAFLAQDNYYRDVEWANPEQLLTHNFDHPDAIDTPLLVEHLPALKQGRAIELPVYDFVTHRRTTACRRIEARPVVRTLADRGILAGVSLGRLYPSVEGLANGLVVAVTETTTTEDVEALATALEHGHGAVHPDVWTLGDPEGLVTRAHEQGLRVNVWTVNQPDQLLRLRDAGVDAVITDVPDLALGVLRA